jgi:phage N-6-adenine-methyltransferase
MLEPTKKPIKKRARKKKPMNDEWYTPKFIIDALGPFDTDPCSPTNDNTIAPLTFTKSQDGLKQDWKGMVWVNPPFSEPLLWILKLIMHRQGILLVRASMETTWMDWALQAADSILFPSPRLKFTDKTGKAEKAANHANIILAYGEEASERLHAAVHRGQISGRLFEESFPFDSAEDAANEAHRKWVDGLSQAELVEYMSAGAEHDETKKDPMMEDELFALLMVERDKKLALKAKVKPRRKRVAKAAA